MKYYKFIFPLLISVVSCKAQNHIDKISEDSIISKWTHAAINVECMNSPSFRKMVILDSIFSRGMIDTQTYIKQHNLITYSAERTSGTVIFVKYNNKHFLLSARHVFADKEGFDSMSICPAIVLVENATTLPNDLSNTIIVDTPITSKSIPTGPTDGRPTLTIKGNHTVVMGYEVLDDSLSEIRSLNHLYNTEKVHSYFFSSIEDDIGIIKLDSVDLGKSFIKTLYKRGYMPINITDFDIDCKIKKYDSVLCFGFPQESIYEITPKSWFRSQVEADFKSYHMITNGFVYNNDPRVNYFEAAIFTYHGFSGGPIIKNNKLIGIINGANFENKMINTQSIRFSRVYHSKFVKSSLIYKLLVKFDSIN